MNRNNLTTTTLYFWGLLHLILASVLLYFAVDMSRTPDDGIMGSMFMLFLAGLGGAPGVALIWKSGSVTWKTNDASEGEDIEHE